MTTTEFLAELHALLATPERWVKSNGAINADGRSVESDDPDAVAWCTTGGCARIVWLTTTPNGDTPFTRGLQIALEAQFYIAQAIQPEVRIGDYAYTLSGFIQRWNDSPTTTYADVIEVIDKAIELARAAEGERMGQ